NSHFRGHPKVVVHVLDGRDCHLRTRLFSRTSDISRKFTSRRRTLEELTQHLFTHGFSLAYQFTLTGAGGIVVVNRRLRQLRRYWCNGDVTPAIRLKIAVDSRRYGN